VLEADEINLRLDAQAGYAVAQDAGLVVALDTALSNELVGEGRAREIVHRIQTLRKDAGLNVEDRIELQYAADDELARLMERYGDYIKRETLARALVTDPTLNGHAWKGEIDGLTLQLALRRAEA
jgi:isoleucyl-tRNA synthetase